MAQFNRDTLKKFKKKKEDKEKNKKYNILVVDDEDSIRSSIVNILQEEYYVVQASNGEEALNMVKEASEEHPIHLIISDQRMPKMTGVQFLRESLSILPESIRIILTGFADIDNIIQSINEARIYQFLTKPIDNQNILLTIKRALENYELEMRNYNLIDELTSFNLELEKKVKDRTQELEKANQSLKLRENELVEFNKNLESLVEERTKELEKSYESLGRADKMASLGVLVAGMAHEVNNPNNFIRINHKVLQNVWQDAFPILRDYEKENGEVMLNRMTLDYAEKSIPKLLKGIQEGTERIADIVKNLKDYGRSAPADLTGNVDLNQSLDNTLFLLENLAKKKTNLLTVEKEKDIPYFRGDSKRVEQVLINLIQNALEALESPKQEVRIFTQQVEDQVIFRIEDEGVGIAEEDLTHVLDPFFTTKRDSSGTGLGLSISAGIIEEHQGIIEFTSTLGKGTTVTLTFPVKH